MVLEMAVNQKLYCLKTCNHFKLVLLLYASYKSPVILNGWKSSVVRLAAMTVATNITIAFLAADVMRQSSRKTRCFIEGFVSLPNFTKSKSYKSFNQVTFIGIIHQIRSGCASYANQKKNGNRSEAHDCIPRARFVDVFEHRDPRLNDTFSVKIQAEQRFNLSGYDV